MQQLLTGAGQLLALFAIGVLVWAAVRRDGRKAVYAAGLFLAGMLVLWFFPPAPDASEPVARSQWSAADVQAGCFTQVQERLLSPSSGRYGRDALATKPEWDPSERSWRWVFTVEAQNAFGVWLETAWVCDVIDDELILVSEL